MASEREGYIQVHYFNTNISIGERRDKTDRFYDPITQKVVTIQQSYGTGEGPRFNVEVSDVSEDRDRQERLRSVGQLVEISGQYFHKTIELDASRRAYAEAQRRIEDAKNFVIHNQMFVATRLLESQKQTVVPVS